MEEILKVTQDGKFIWHPDADRLIEEGDYSNSPAMYHILRALRAKQEQGEPVAVIGSGFQLLYCRHDWSKGLEVGDKLYTTPQQRTWVGLTNDEFLNIWYNSGKLEPFTIKKNIEAKLKEKNT